MLEFICAMGLTGYGILRLCFFQNTPTSFCPTLTLLHLLSCLNFLLPVLYLSHLPILTLVLLLSSSRRCLLNKAVLIVLNLQFFLSFSFIAREMPVTTQRGYLSSWLHHNALDTLVTEQSQEIFVFHPERTFWTALSKQRENTVPRRCLWPRITTQCWKN